jgi:amino acid adenylation domain-containing protein
MPFLGKYLGWVEATPDAIALETYTEKLSYRELHRKVRAYAHCMSGSKASVIAVDANGSWEMNAAIIAVMLMGKTLVPIHPDWPTARKTIALTESEASILLVFDENTACPEGAWNVVTDPGQCPDEECAFPSFEPGQCETPAYILFTSGSTGVPKGVPVPYRALNVFLRYYTEEKEYGFDPADRFLQTYDASFDVFYFPLLVSLETGACCCLLPPRKQRRSLLILEALQHYRITVVSMVPTVLQVVASLLTRISLPDLRLSFFSGDILSRKLALLWEQVCPDAVIYNCYGPTETTIVCTSIRWNEFRGHYTGSIFPLGFPFPDTVVKVLNQGKACGVGEVGELYIGGPQVFNGYLNQGHQGVEDGFFPSGDLVHADDHGCLHFHGRKDFQVKVGGYRIETEEVASSMAEALHRDVVVLAVREQDNTNYLVAFVQTEEPLNVAELAALLKPLLPHYMIPGRYVAVKEWPYNANGKINRRQLASLINQEC